MGSPLPWALVEASFQAHRTSRAGMNGLIKLVLVFSGMALASGCKVKPQIQESQKNLEDPSITSIKFSFHDASVPPDSHRSYDFIIEKSRLQFTVDSYGEIIKDTAVNINYQKWNEIQEALSACDISKTTKAEEENEGCTGGTGHSLQIIYENGTSWKGHVYRCGNRNSGNLQGDLNCFNIALRANIDPKVFAYD